MKLNLQCERLPIVSKSAIVSTIADLTGFKTFDLTLDMFWEPKFAPFMYLYSKIKIKYFVIEFSCPRVATSSTTPATSASITVFHPTNNYVSIVCDSDYEFYGDGNVESYSRLTTSAQSRRLYFDRNKPVKYLYRLPKVLGNAMDITDFAAQITSKASLSDFVTAYTGNVINRLPQRYHIAYQPSTVVFTTVKFAMGFELIGLKRITEPDTLETSVSDDITV